MAKTNKSNKNIIDTLTVKRDSTVKYVALALEDKEPHLVAILDDEGLNVLYCLDRKEAGTVINMVLNQFKYEEGITLLGCRRDILPYFEDYKNKFKIKGTVYKVVDEVTDKKNRVFCDGLATVIKMLENYPDMEIVISKKK